MEPRKISIKLLKSVIHRYLDENPMMLTKAEKEQLVKELQMLGTGRYQPTYHLSDLIYFSCKLDLYKEFEKLISKKMSLRGCRILDVGPGRHIRSSIALKSKGAKVVAMDPEARKREGISVIASRFTPGTALDEYQLVTGLQLPKVCIESIVEASEMANKKYLLVPSGDAFEGEEEILKFITAHSGARKERWEVDGLIRFNVITNL